MGALRLWISQMLLAAAILNELLSRLRDPLVIFGLSGQFIFMLRFVVQWFASERAGRSHVPVAFWWLSIAGGAVLLLYGILDRDPVIILGQALAMLIYVRNLMLIHRRAARLKRLLNQRRVSGDSPQTAATREPGSLVAAE